MSFRFNFSSAADSDDELDTSASIPSQNDTILAPALLPPKPHTLRSLASTVPRNISYTTLHLSSTLSLPRRELYDVRMQLMSEEDPLCAPDTAAGPNDLLTTSATTDVLKNVYEGGLKSWECSLDLSRFLSTISSSSIDNSLPVSILELGCGSALPSLYLFQELLRAGDAARGARLVLADYNLDVLRLVTLPNLFLIWAREEQKWLPEEGDMDAAPSLVERFVEDLEKRGIEVGFVEGAWGAEMVELLNGDGRGYRLVLASETIYEPRAMGSFVDTLLGNLDTSVGVGLVAAKKHYFGVGGGVQDFIGVVNERGGWEAGIVDETGEAGVRRCVVKVNKQL